MIPSTPSTAAVLFVCGLSLLSSSAIANPPRRPIATQKSAGGPVVSTTATAVRATGLPPGTRAYFAAVSQETIDATLTIEREAGSAVADAEGIATFTPPRPIRARAVWLVVTPTGYTVAPSEGGLLQEMDLPGNAVQGANGAFRRFVLDRYAVFVALVRHGSGIWTADLVDGASSDNDETSDGAVALDIARLTPRAGAPPPPDKFENGDVIFAVNPLSLEFAVSRRGN